MESNLMPSVQLPPGFIWHLCSKIFMGRRQKPFSLTPLEVRIWIQSVCVEISVELWCGISPPQITGAREHERARKNCFWLFDLGEENIHLAVAEWRLNALQLWQADAGCYGWLIAEESIELSKELLESFSVAFLPKVFSKKLDRTPLEKRV